MTELIISGLDGTGKTTLIENLIKMLSQKGVNCGYFWGKIDSLVLNILIKLYDIFTNKTNNNEIEFKKRRNIKGKFVKFEFIKKIMTTISINSYKLRIKKIFRSFEKNKKEIIFADRYILDTLVDLSYDFNLDNDKLIEIKENLSEKLPKPSIEIILKNAHKISLERKDDIYDKELLKAKSLIYDVLINKFEYIVVNGENSEKDLFNIVTNILVERNII